MEWLLTKFEVDADYLPKFKVENVGAEIHNELWVPSEELKEFNKHIVGKRSNSKALVSTM